MENEWKMNEKEMKSIVFVVFFKGERGKDEELIR
jgi:hypothetical protein